MTVGSQPPAPLAPPDRLAFATDALALHGALIEREGPATLAVLPEQLAASLGVPEECRLVSSSGTGASASDAVAVDFGSPLLEHLVELAQTRAVGACSRLDAEPPRLSQARSLAERFTVRNGVHEVLEMTAGKATYASVWLRWTAECDDRQEGLVQVVLAERDGSEPDPRLVSLVDPVQAMRLLPLALAQPSEQRRAHLAHLVTRRAEALIRAAVAPAVESAQRRLTRDHDRVARYFEDLAQEARQAARRRKVDAAALKEKLGHYAAERDAKLAELQERFSLRVSAEPAVLVRVEVAALFMRVRIRRRKAARELMLGLPAEASALDRQACEGCGAPTGAPAVCDEHLHLLCSECAPSAQGRIACPACRG